VGFSHTTGQMTHHIAPEVDAERDRLLQTLQQAGQVGQVSWIEHFHQRAREEGNILLRDLNDLYTA
jgi:hypothetical protein